jgi:hypothetical protein
VFIAIYRFCILLCIYMYVVYIYIYIYTCICAYSKKLNRNCFFLPCLAFKHKDSSLCAIKTYIKAFLLFCLAFSCNV